MLTRARFSFALAILAAPGTHSQTPLPTWAQARWERVAKAKGLKLSPRITPSLLQGDFDGDGKSDVAVFVVNGKSGKQGIVFLHQNGDGPFVVGAGTPLGNGGDDFEWMDKWSIKRHGTTSRRDMVLVERESSASGLVYFENHRYRWKQQGD